VTHHGSKSRTFSVSVFEGFSAVLSADLSFVVTHLLINFEQLFNNFLNGHPVNRFFIFNNRLTVVYKAHVRLG
jgi:hypothetical protein